MKDIDLLFSSYSSWPVSVSPCNSHSGVVVFRYPIRGQRYTKLCPYCYSSILGPSKSCRHTLSPRDPTSPSSPAALQSHHRIFYSPESPIA